MGVIAFRIKSLIRQQIIEDTGRIDAVLEDLRTLAGTINSEADVMTDIVKQKQFRYKASAIRSYIEQAKNIKQTLFINLEIKDDSKT